MKRHVTSAKRNALRRITHHTTIIGMSFMARPPRPPVQADGHSKK